MSDEIVREVPLFEIFDIVVCGETYGYVNAVLMQALHEWASPFSADDIEAFCAQDFPDYDQEELDSWRETLGVWSEKYGGEHDG